MHNGLSPDTWLSKKEHSEAENIIKDGQLAILEVEAICLAKTAGKLEVAIKPLLTGPFDMGQ
jgi:hypothetical protein